jgi:hypothetical protein
MKEKLQILMASIKSDFPDLSEMEGSVQYDYIKALEEMILDAEWLADNLLRIRD